jgi:hypothetical protein
MYGDTHKSAGCSEPINNPIEIERDFQRLLLSLSCPGTPRQRLFKINIFWETLGNNFTEHEPYLLELIERLLDLVRDLNYLGCDPETLQALFEKTRLLHAHFSLCDEVPGLAEVVKKLRQAVARLYAYTGEIGSALKILEEKFSETCPDWINQLAEEPTNRPLLLLQRAHEEAKRHDETTAAKLHHLITQWSPHDAGGTVVPVIEHAINDVDNKDGEGGLRRIAITILGEAKAGKDDVHADVAVFGAESDATTVTQIPLAAARRLLVENYPPLAKRFFTGQVAFEAAHALHEGASANLAIAALFYCAALHQTDQRERFHLAPGVALTGDLNRAGEVLPVDGKKLATKVKAACFSWVEYLVVPKPQLGEAEVAARALAQRYPNRHLTIIGVGHLREIFFDRRLTRRKCTGMIKHLARKAWRNKFTVGGITTTALLMLIIGKLLYGPIDNNPVAGDFVEESLLVKNKYGEQIDEIWVGAPTTARANEDLATRRGFAAFYDVDKDGKNEVISLQEATRETDNTSLAYCKAVVKDSLLWSAPLRRVLHFPNNSGTESDHLRPQGILAGDFDGDGAGEVFVIARHDLFPSLVLKLDAKTGRELGHYIHAGHLEALQAVDLDDDGITEILLCGINNAFRAACLVVLDPRFVAGQSPSAGAYVLEDYLPGLERAYMLIPKTIVGEALRYKSKYNRVKGVEIQKSSKRFVLLLNDVSPADKMYLAVNSANLLGLFEFDLQPESFGTADDYDLMAEKLFDDKQISRKPDKAYFEEYKKTLRYWDGESWQNQPVLNKHYLQRRGE